jgi:hypothetical protein
MRRLVALVVLLTLLPATAALGTDLDELLTRGKDASYSAEQVISCSTPDGERDALIRIEQDGDDLRVSSNLGDDVEITAGAGGWTLTRDDGLVAQANVDRGETEASPLYTVEERGTVEYLGRAAMAYLLIRGGEPRAELVIDDETGAVVEAVTLTIDDEVYCERRFLSLDADTPAIEESSKASGNIPATLVDTSSLPQSVAGFELLDQYEDEDGVRFAYYSDGFFSFALFETPSAVALPEATPVELSSGPYLRVFTAGQVTYVWETRQSGMALVGDLPPDLHEAVLSEMPHPEDPGFFRRWWRSLFG